MATARPVIDAATRQAQAEAWDPRASAWALRLHIITLERLGQRPEVERLLNDRVANSTDADLRALLPLLTMAGLFADFTPKFVRRYADLGSALGEAAAAYARDVRARLRLPSRGRRAPSGSACSIPSSARGWWSRARAAGSGRNSPFNSGARA